jgi:hypothetical protein
MIPKPGQRVKCFMRTTTVLEGIVEEWSDNQVVLKSLNGESLMIVHRPLEDIMITKIVLEKILEENPGKEPIIPVRPSQGKTTMAEALKQVLESTDEDLNQANLKRLRELVVEQDKKLIAQKRKEHFGNTGNAKMAVNYSNSFLLGGAYKPGKLPNTPGVVMTQNHRKKK